MQTQTAPTAKPNGNSPAPTTSAPSESRALTLREATARFQGQLTDRRDEYAPALPSHITPERFQRVVMTAVNLNPKLLNAERRSLLNACCKAASDGLLPDGREGALVIFRKKVVDAKGNETWDDSVQWMPMVYGIIKKARQSGEISVLDAQIVYSEELAQGRFTYKRVDGVPKIDHEPIIQGERGVPVLVYSVVKFKDGSIDYEVLHAKDVEKIRAVSRSKDKGPWAEWTEEMWKKSAIRRHAKRLPVSSELFETISRDDELTEFERQRIEAEDAMRAAARKQLGAPPREPLPQADDLPDGDVIDVTAETDEAGGELELEAGNDSDEFHAELKAKTKALSKCKTEEDIAAIVEGMTVFLKENGRRDLLADFLAEAKRVTDRLAK